MNTVGQERQKIVIEKPLSEAGYNSYNKRHKKEGENPVCYSPMVSEEYIHSPESCYVVKVRCERRYEQHPECHFPFKSKLRENRPRKGMSYRIHYSGSIFHSSMSVFILLISFFSSIAFLTFFQPAISP